MTDKEKLELIKQRYLGWKDKPSNGYISHLMACKIHQAKKFYGMAPCTCGLLYDLNSLLSGTDLADKIYPNYSKDYLTSNTTWEEEQEVRNRTPEEKEEMKRQLIKQFGEPVMPPPDEVDRLEVNEWNLIREVFGHGFVERSREKAPEGNHGYYKITVDRPSLPHEI